MFREESLQDMSVDSKFGPNEEIWAPEIRTESFEAVSQLS